MPIFFFFPNFNILWMYLTIDGVLDLMKYDSFILCVFAFNAFLEWLAI